MKEIFLLELDKKILIEVLKITEKENNRLSNFISEMIEKNISHHCCNDLQYGNNQEGSIDPPHLSLLFKNRQNFHEVIENGGGIPSSLTFNAGAVSTGRKIAISGNIH